MKHNREFGIAFLKKYTGDSDDRVIALEYDSAIAGLPVSARIDRKWLEFSISLAKLNGAGDLPSVDEVYTDRFAAITAE